jgi:hypothetical protein
VAKATPTRFDFAKQSAPNQSTPTGFIAHVICCWFMLTLYAVGLWSTVCGGGLRRREKPDPGARPNPAGSSAETGEVRNPHARLQRPRYDDPVRRAQYARWQGHRPLCAAPSPSGVIRFIATVERSVPTGKVIHAILDNYAAHKHPQVLAWLAEHPRWTFHFTPTSCSWLNAVEGFFSRLTGRASNGPSFTRLATSKARSPATSPPPTGNQALGPERDRKNHPGQAQAEPSV